MAASESHVKGPKKIAKRPGSESKRRPKLQPRNPRIPVSKVRALSLEDHTKGPPRARSLAKRTSSTVPSEVASVISESYSMAPSVASAPALLPSAPTSIAPFLSVTPAPALSPMVTSLMQRSALEPVPQPPLPPPTPPHGYDIVDSSRRRGSHSFCISIFEAGSPCLIPHASSLFPPMSSPAPSAGSPPLVGSPPLAGSPVLELAAQRLSLQGLWDDMPICMPHSRPESSQPTNSTSFSSGSSPPLLSTVSSTSPPSKYSICPICLRFFYEFPVTTLVCGHQFHTFCIRQWLGINATCPYCRTIVSPPTPCRSPTPAIENSPAPSQNHTSEMPTVPPVTIPVEIPLSAPAPSPSVMSTSSTFFPMAVPITSMPLSPAPSATLPPITPPTSIHVAESTSSVTRYIAVPHPADSVSSSSSTVGYGYQHADRTPTPVDPTAARQYPSLPSRSPSSTFYQSSPEHMAYPTPLYPFSVPTVTPMYHSQLVTPYTPQSTVNTIPTSYYVPFTQPQFVSPYSSPMYSPLPTVVSTPVQSPAPSMHVSPASSTNVSIYAPPVSFNASTFQQRRDSPPTTVAWVVPTRGWRIPSYG